MEVSRLKAFYLGEEPDTFGRMIDEILSYSDEQLEGVHNYIQWLFPLGEKSAFNASAPLLTADDIVAFKNDSKLRKKLLNSFGRLLRFYGFMFAIDCSIGILERSKSFEQRSRNWLAPRNHNFLRITRILKSLTLLGCSEYAVVFLRSLEEVYKVHFRIIGEETLTYWRNAVESR